MKFPYGWDIVIFLLGMAAGYVLYFLIAVVIALSV